MCHMLSKVLSFSHFLYLSTRPFLLCEDTKDGQPVPWVSCPKSVKWSCNTLWEKRSRSTCDRWRWVQHFKANMTMWFYANLVNIYNAVNTQSNMNFPDYSTLFKHSLGTDGLVDPARPLTSFSPQPWHSCHKLIYVRPNPKTGVPVGHWPIPESFWPDQNSPTLVNLHSKIKQFLLSCCRKCCSSIYLPPGHWHLLAHWNGKVPGRGLQKEIG